MPSNKKKRKRRINWRNLLFLLVPALIVVVLAVLIPIYRDHKIQNSRQEMLATILSERQDFIQQVKSVELKDADASDETREYFEKIRQMALDENAQAYTGLENLVDQRISDDQDKALKALSPQSDGHKFLAVLQKADEIDPYWIKFLGKDDDRIDFVSEYFNQEAYQNPPATLSQSLDSVPALLQWDQAWGYLPYGDMNIAFAGCAPTCLSMVVSYLKQDPSITPVVLARQAEANGDYVYGSGTAYSIFPSTAEKYGLEMNGVAVDVDSITQALNDGQVLIAHAVPGKFTSIGHFMVITGVKDGKLIVHDPNSKKNTNKLWDPEEMLPEFDLIWGFSK